MPAQPVGPSPGFRAVACVCMVTSPNKVEVACRSLRTSCARLLLPISLNTNGLADLSRKKIQIEVIIWDLVSRNLATPRLTARPSGRPGCAVSTGSGQARRRGRLAVYNESVPEISRFFGMIAGSLPRRQRHFVEAWADLHQGELRVDWQRLQEGRKPVPIEPLK